MKKLLSIMLLCVMICSIAMLTACTETTFEYSADGTSKSQTAGSSKSETVSNDENSSTKPTTSLPQTDELTREQMQLMENSVILDLTALNNATAVYHDSQGNAISTAEIKSYTVYKEVEEATRVRVIISMLVEKVYDITQGNNRNMGFMLSPYSKPNDDPNEAYVLREDGSKTYVFEDLDAGEGRYCEFIFLVEYKPEKCRYFKFEISDFFER